MFKFLVWLVLMGSVIAMESKENQLDKTPVYKVYDKPQIEDMGDFLKKCRDIIRKNNGSYDLAEIKPEAKEKILEMEKFCEALKKNIELPPYLDDLYRCYEQIEMRTYIHNEPTSQTYDRLQMIMNIRYVLFSKRVELFHLSKKDK